MPRCGLDGLWAKLGCGTGRRRDCTGGTVLGQWTQGKGGHVTAGALRLEHSTRGPVTNVTQTQSGKLYQRSFGRKPYTPAASSPPRAQGVELKLLALDRLLEQHPEWRGQLVLVQVGAAWMGGPAG